MYDQALRPVRLKITQFSQLRNVQRLQPVSISRLAKEMALDRSTLGRNLLVLERRALVELSGAEDLRERSVQLTPRGSALLGKAIPCWEAAQRKLQAKLGAGDTRTLLTLLSKLEGVR